MWVPDDIMHLLKNCTVVNGQIVLVIENGKYASYKVTSYGTVNGAAPQEAHRQPMRVEKSFGTQRS